MARWYKPTKVGGGSLGCNCTVDYLVLLKLSDTFDIDPISPSKFPLYAKRVQTRDLTPSTLIRLLLTPQIHEGKWFQR